MIADVTDNGVKYDWYVTGPQGARFELYVHEGHSKSQIEAAKEQLKREQDVVKFYIIKLTRKEWNRLKLFFHPVANINDKLNEEYHEQSEH